MTRLPPVVALLVVCGLASASGQAPARGSSDAIASFARLYGVVRYFYPSDAAAAIDWDRFAIHGVRQARAAGDTARLQTALQQLFAPLGPGIEIGSKLTPAPAIGEADASLVAWRYLGPGMGGSSPSNPYKGKRTNRAMVASAGEGFAAMTQSVPALDLRGKTVRLRGHVRVTPRAESDTAALWLRVDRSEQRQGFFDNMGDRPIRDREWRQYTIEGKVDSDATNVVFGVLAVATVTADFDALDLAVRDDAGNWTPIDIKDAGFEAAVDAAGGWTRPNMAAPVQVTRPTDNAPEGKQYLRLSSAMAATGAGGGGDPFESTPKTGDYADVDLGSGLRARVRLALTQAEAASVASSAAPLVALRSALAALPAPADTLDADVRQADVVVAWNVFRHFYPYWKETGVDWDAQLRPWLDAAQAAPTRAAHLEVMRGLVAAVRDGHGNVNDPRTSAGRSFLPLQLVMIDGQLVISATAAATEAPVGAVLRSIGGVPAVKRVAELQRLWSGSDQWKTVRALQELVMCSAGSAVEVVIDRGNGPQTSSLTCAAKQPPTEQRPPEVGELSPGIWYVDLTRAQMPQIQAVVAKLAEAAGVVFDVRGYPTAAGAQMLPYLLTTAEADRWMHINKIVGPFARSDGWQSVGWNMQPRSPRIAGKVVFLTDGRAISYAESVMGYVADRKLATIVGSPTAGANGNVVLFVVPSAFRIAFTGMKVTGHDGQATHHLAGVKPTIAAAPTIAGLRAGRDEVLERGVAVIRGQ
jgi:hypothetical protein